VEGAGNELGRIDVLANCHGWHGDTLSILPFAEQDEAHWLQVLALELVATIRLVRCVLPHMIAQGFGRIVTLASESAKVGQGGIAGNAAARVGCVAFSKSVAREVGRHGINVTWSAPARSKAPRSTCRPGSGPENRRAHDIDDRSKRAGTARDVADVVAFLASPQAGYVTGQAISVSGGLTMC